MGNELIEIEYRKKFSVTEQLDIVFKYKRRIGVIFLVLATAVSISAYLLTPVYEAQSTLLVKMGREYMSRPEVGDKTPMLALNQDAIVNTELQILSSRELLEKVVTTMKVENLYPDIARNPPSDMSPVNAALLRFEKGISASRIPGSNVIQVTFRHKSPEIASKALNLLVSLFRVRHLQVYSDPQSSFLDQQLQDYKQKLTDSQNALERFKQSNRVYSINEQRTLLLKQQMDLDTALKSSNNGIYELQNKVLTLRSQIKSVSAADAHSGAPETTSVISDAKAKLLTLQLNEQDLLKKYTESNRYVVNARKEIQLVDDFIKEQEREAAVRAKTGNPLYQDLRRDLLRSEADLAALTARAASLRNQLASVGSEMRTINMTEQQLENLKREKAVNEKNFEVYQDRAEESRILDEMNRLKLTNVSVIQPADVPLVPVKPNRLKIVLVGLLCGAAIAVGSAFLTERISRKYNTPDRVEELLGVPVLISIPYHKG